MFVGTGSKPEHKPLIGSNAKNFFYLNNLQDHI